MAMAKFVMHSESRDGDSRRRDNYGALELHIHQDGEDQEDGEKNVRKKRKLCPPSVDVARDFKVNLVALAEREPHGQARVDTDRLAILLQHAMVQRYDIMK